MPAYSRPRDGRPVDRHGRARTGRPPIHGGNGGGYYYNPYYRYNYYYNRYPYGYYYAGYGFGLGYFYDPWMWGYYVALRLRRLLRLLRRLAADPYGGYGGGYGGGYSREQYRDIGRLRLKVKPEHGPGLRRRLLRRRGRQLRRHVPAAADRGRCAQVEIRAEGYETVQFEVMVIPGETVTYKGELKRIVGQALR